MSIPAAAVVLFIAVLSSLMESGLVFTFHEAGRRPHRAFLPQLSPAASVEEPHRVAHRLGVPVGVRGFISALCWVRDRKCSHQYEQRWSAGAQRLSLVLV
jgi:hypothetical protein